MQILSRLLFLVYKANISVTINSKTTECERKWFLFTNNSWMSLSKQP